MAAAECWALADGRCRSRRLVEQEQPAEAAEALEQRSALQQLHGEQLALQALDLGVAAHRQLVAAAAAAALPQAEEEWVLSEGLGLSEQGSAPAPHCCRAEGCCPAWAGSVIRPGAWHHCTQASVAPCDS